MGGYVTPVSGTGPGGTGLTTLWEWNGTDITQFDEVGDASFTISVTDWTTRFAGAIDDEAPCIQINNPATANGFKGLLIEASELASVPTRFVIQWRACNRTAGGTQDLGVLVYYENTTHFVGIRHTNTGAQFCRRDNATAYTDTSPQFGQHTASDRGEYYSVGINVDPASAAQKPYVVNEGHLQRVFQHTAGHGELIVPVDVRANFNANWQSLGSYDPRIGIFCRTFGGAAAPGNVIGPIRILQWPF